jgi:hypothetical protein
MEVSLEQTSSLMKAPKRHKRLEASMILDFRHLPTVKGIENGFLERDSRCFPLI